MFPHGLTPPLPDTFKTTPGALTPPADYPFGMPFVPNQPCTYGESESVALCIWELRSPGAEAPARDGSQVAKIGEKVLAGEPIDADHLRSGWTANMDTPGQAFEHLLGILRAFGQAAVSGGWQVIASEELELPPGARYRRYKRNGRVIVAMAIPTSVVQTLTVTCFNDHAA